MGSALLNTDTADSTSSPPAGSTSAGPDALPSFSHAAALRQQAAERVAAHRGRYAQSQQRTAPEPARPANGRSARIAAAVAERYAQTQTYRAFLAAEAERAVQQARAAAEIAALNAQAVAAAQQSLLDTFDRAAVEDAPPAGDGYPVEEDTPQSSANPLSSKVAPHPDAVAAEDAYLFPNFGSSKSKPAPRHRAAHTHHETPHDLASAPEPRTPNREPRFTVRLYEDASSAAHVDLDAAHRTPPPVPLSRRPDRNDPEALALDEEIAFRQAPVFEEPPGPPMPLPANLIEFPRQLVAPRKARPRLAEGPLREDPGDAPGDGQLRIFEVDPAQISTIPEPETEATSEATVPQWTSIWLDAPASPAVPLSANPGAQILAAADGLAPWSGTPGRSQAQSGMATRANPAAPLPGAASIGRRMLAAAINGAILFAAVLVFAAVYVSVAAHILPWHAGPLHTLFARICAGTGLQLRQLPAAIAVLAGSLLLLYQALFFWFSTATPGMRCARIALCTFDDENPTRKTLRRRVFGLLLSACPLGLGFLWAALDEDRLTWHDRLSRTYQRSY